MRSWLGYTFSLAALAGCASDVPGNEPPPDDLGDPGLDVAPAAMAMPPALCDAAHPVKLVVGMYGQDGASVHGLVGIDLIDADNQRVDRDGVPAPQLTSYPIVLNYNPTYDYDGKPAGTAGEVRSWTGCVGANVSRAYFEAYPRDATGATNRTKYGETVYQYVAIGGPGSYGVTLRFPVVWEWANPRGLPASTGNIFGHVVCNGVPAVPDHAHIRAWSAQPGSACGVRSFSASAEASTDPAYKISALAGGQCYGPSQPTNVYVRGNCNGRYRQVVKEVSITTGKTLPLNIDLAAGTDQGPAHTY